jgi:recombination protein RecA
VVDPSSTLYGPGVVAAGVERERLLVVRPEREALERSVVRLAESRAFSVLVVDTAGVAGASIGVALGSWLRVIRKLALAAEGTGTCILLVTDADAPRPLPLPVALRLELAREAIDRLSIRIGKERRGRISGKRIVKWPLANGDRHVLETRAKPLSLVPARRAVSS